MILPRKLYRCVLLVSVGGFLSTFPLARSAFAAANLAISPTTLNFGQLAVGRVKTTYANLRNTGTSKATVSSITASLSVYTVQHSALPFTLAAGQSVKLTITFSPSVTGTDNASVSINGKASLSLNGSAVADPIVINPQSLSFGNVQDGNTATKSVTMTNKTSGNLRIASDSTAGAGFSIQGLSTPLTLGPSESYTFKIAFSPKSAAAVSGSFKAFNSGNTILAMIPLSGTGTGAGILRLSPTSVAFGNVNVGSTLSRAGTVSAVSASVTISSAASSSGEFVLSGISLPKTLTAGQTAPYTVTFKPQSSGAASATIAFASNASGTAAESLSGTGVGTSSPPPATYTVSLTWNPSSSTVTGYNVYRGSKSGGPYAKVNSSLDAATNYSDGTVAASNTYYYVTTAVNSSGQESKYSNQVQVVIP